MGIKSEERVFPDGLAISGVDEILNAKKGKPGTISVAGGVFGNGDGKYIGLIRLHLPSGNSVTMESKKAVDSLEVATQELEDQMKIVLRQVEEATKLADQLTASCDCGQCGQINEVIAQEIAQARANSTDRVVH